MKFWVPLVHMGPQKLPKDMFCVVCTRSTPPLLTLNDEEMSIYDLMVSPFINLELLIKSHTILVCSSCKGQIDQMQHFRVVAVAGARHLQNFLMDFDSSEAKDKGEEATIQLEPKHKTESETALKPKIEEEYVESDLIIELERQEDFDVDVEGASVEAPRDARRGSGPLPTSPSNEEKPAVSQDYSKRRLTNGGSGDTATPSTSGAQARIPQTSGISKTNMYDPKFLNKYFSEAFSQTNKPEPDVVPSDPKGADASPPEPSEGTSTASARSRRALTNIKKMVKCRVCGASFMNAGYLAAHARTRHATPIPKAPAPVAGPSSEAAPIARPPKKRRPPAPTQSMPVLTDMQL